MPIALGTASSRMEAGVQPRKRGQCRLAGSSAFRVLLGCPRVELVPDDGLVADDPGVVTWLDDVRLARLDFLLAAVLVDDVHRSRLQQTDVVGLTVLASHDRPDAFRPSPARLQPHP